jgi:hypothetical protein
MNNINRAFAAASDNQDLDDILDEIEQNTYEEKERQHIRRQMERYLEGKHDSDSEEETAPKLEVKSNRPSLHNTLRMHLTDIDLINSYYVPIPDVTNLNHASNTSDQLWSTTTDIGPDTYENVNRKQEFEMPDSFDAQQWSKFYDVLKKTYKAYNTNDDWMTGFEFARKIFLSRFGNEHMGAKLKEYKYNVLHIGGNFDLLRGMQHFMKSSQYAQYKMGSMDFKAIGKLGRLGTYNNQDELGMNYYIDAKTPSCDLSKRTGQAWIMSEGKKISPYYDIIICDVMPATCQLAIMNIASGINQLRTQDGTLFCRFAHSSKWGRFEFGLLLILKTMFKTVEMFVPPWAPLKCYLICDTPIESKKRYMNMMLKLMNVCVGDIDSVPIPFDEETWDANQAFFEQLSNLRYYFVGYRGAWIATRALEASYSGIISITSGMYALGKT